MEYILGDFHAIFNETVTEESEEITEFIELTRQDLLKAVSKTMYHIKDSQQIWKPYSEFELEVLNKFKTPYQLERVKNMFMERLQVLHIDCEDTFSAYSSFVTTWDNANYEKILSETNKLYAKTKRAAEERDVFEMKLVANGYALDSFYEYIENEKLTKLMPLINNVRCLYERAIVYYCTDPNLWDDYILYLVSLFCGGVYCYTNMALLLNKNKNRLKRQKSMLIYKMYVIALFVTVLGQELFTPIKQDY